jgi:flagellar assembly protein FliH
MSLFKREGPGSVTKAEFNVRPSERRARTSWLAPPIAPAPASVHEEEPLRPSVAPDVEAPLQTPKPRSERPPEARALVEEPAPAPHPPTIHAAFIVNHGQARVTELLDRLTASIELLASERAKILGGAEEQLVALAAAIARRVISRELTVDPTLLAELAAEGIETLGAKERIVVRLGELDDEASFEAIRNRLAGRAPQCQVVHDATLARGGCVVQTEHGTVDESLEARLESVVKAIQSEPEGGGS